MIILGVSPNQPYGVPAQANLEQQTMVLSDRSLKVLTAIRQFTNLRVLDLSRNEIPSLRHQVLLAWSPPLPSLRDSDRHPIL